MRIALVSTPSVRVPPASYGGTELVVHELARGLDEAGHDVTLFATGDSEAGDVRYVYPRPVWPPSPEAEARHASAAARVIARERFDVVHAHVPSLLTVDRPLHAPVVYTLHHDHEDALTELYVRRPDVDYVAISERQAELESHLECHVVHHALDPERYPPGEGERGDAVFLGRLSPCKAPDLAVEAAISAGLAIRVADRLHEEDDSPEWKRTLEVALRRPGVAYVGAVGGDAKSRFLGGARALLMPLRWEEPFGLVMIESMLTGTPVIAFPRGAAPEIVDEGVTGFLVDGVAEMSAVLRQLDAFDRARCRRRAVARFDATRMVRDYEAVYASAARSRAWTVRG